MKKTKIPTLKEIEDNWDDWIPVTGERLEQIKARNARMRAERAAKDAKFTARANADDLEAFKKIAAHNRIPYQTLLGHLLRKFVIGDLVDVEQARKMFARHLKKK